MIAKAEWFSRRKYTGWGLTPKTWQGFLYVIIMAGVVVMIQSLPVQETVKLIAMVAWIIIFVVDLLHTMASLKLDEREQKIEAMAERNAAWTMVAASVVLVIFVSTMGSELRGSELMPALLLPIGLGVLVKGISNFVLERRGI